MREFNDFDRQMTNQKDIIGLMKYIILESSDSPNKSMFSPEMYYLVTLYILEHGFDFYSDDIFKYFLLKGYLYFKEKKINIEEKMYVSIFENEIKNWNPSFLFNDFEEILIELLNNEKEKIIKALKTGKFLSKNMEKNINIIAKKINKKYKKNNINSEEEFLDKLFF